MSLTETEKEVYRLAGRVDGHDSEIKGMRDQLADIQSISGGFDAKLDRLIVNFGSGTHRALPAPEPQEAIEPKTNSWVGRLNSLLMNPKILHILYPLIGLLGLAMVLSFWSGRPTSDFLRFDQPSHRSAIGPIERTGSEASGPSGKPTNRGEVQE